jgi:acyl carrier protein
VEELEPAAVRRRVREFICSEILERPEHPLADTDRLITGGLVDSFSLARIGVFVEEAFGIDLPDTWLSAAKMDSLEAIVRTVLEAGEK